MGLALIATRVAPSQRASGAPIRSLAVLPLESLSANPDEVFLADGMTDELITSLAKIGSLRVISRTSVMPYRVTHKTVPEIARELGVDGVVEGAILRSGGRVRINAQLIQASTDRHLWAEEYERDASDMLFLQNDVARDIAQSIHVRLTPLDESRLSAAREGDLATEDLYWKGIYFVNKLTTPDFKRARDYFQQMIQKKPLDPRAWSGLAMANHHFAMWGDFNSFQRAKQAAQKSIDLDGSRAEPRAELAMLAYVYDWNIPEAERLFRLAVETNPNYPHAHYYYMLFLAHTGRSDEAIREITLARRLDPLSVNTAAMAWHAYFCGRQYDKALQVAQDVVATDPTFAAAHFRLSLSFQQEREYLKAIDEERLSSIFGDADPKDVDLQIAALKRAYEVEGVEGYWREKLRKALQSNSPDGHFGTDGIAAIYMHLNKKEKALDWIERGILEHDPYILFWVPVLSEFDPLRNDPRYQRIFAPYGLPVARGH